MCCGGFRRLGRPVLGSSRGTGFIREVFEDREEVRPGPAKGSTAATQSTLLHKGAGAEDALGERLLVQAVALLEAVGTHQVGLGILIVAEDLADAADDAVEIRPLSVTPWWRSFLMGNRCWSLHP